MSDAPERRAFEPGAFGPGPDTEGAPVGRDPVAGGPGRARKVGLPPGSLVYTGPQRVERVRVDLLRYDRDALIEHSDLPLERALAEAAPDAVTWIDVIGLHDPEVVRRVGEAFGLHPLTLEDVVNNGQRPKVELYDGYLYLVLRMLTPADDPGAPPHNEQLSLVLAPGVVITFQEQPGDVFAPVRERLRRSSGRIRSLGADYLAYALIDVIVDSYFVVLEGYSDRIEALEDEVFADPSPAVLEAARRLKGETLYLRRAVWPVREMMAQLQRQETPLLGAEVLTFLRDVQDHAVQAIDTVETLRELLSSLQDAYMSSLSIRMNEVMKVLTVISTIFIPLGFLVGVYGMNFDAMPELHLRWAYPALWGVMVVTVVGMLVYFRRKGWL